MDIAKEDQEKLQAWADENNLTIAQLLAMMIRNAEFLDRIKGEGHRIYMSKDEKKFWEIST